MSVTDLLDPRIVAFEVTALVLVKATLVLGPLWIVSRLLPRARGATRSTLWLLGFAAVLVAPWIPHLAPAWSLPILPSGLLTAGLFGGEAVVRGGWLGEAIIGRAAEDSVSAVSLIFLAWLVGAVFFLGRLALDLIRVKVFLRSARPAPERIRRPARRLAERLGVRREVRLLVAPDAAVPFTWGVRRPVVVLPASAEAWSAGRVEAILRHELAHVGRRDFVGLLVAEVARALYWLNPLAWIGVREFRLVQEVACDEAAVRPGVPAAEDARHLLAVARSGLPAAPLPRGALPMARRSTLRARIRGILAGAPGRGPARPPVGYTLAGAFAVAAAVGAATLNPWFCEQDPVPPSPHRGAIVTTSASPDDLPRPIRPVDVGASGG